MGEKIRGVSSILVRNDREVESRWKEYFSVLLNRYEDREANVNMAGFVWLHRGGCREQIMYKMKNVIR